MPILFECNDLNFFDNKGLPLKEPKELDEELRFVEYEENGGLYYEVEIFHKGLSEWIEVATSADGVDNCISMLYTMHQKIKELESKLIEKNN